jgi:hypothetical protein
VDSDLQLHKHLDFDNHFPQGISELFQRCSRDYAVALSMEHLCGNNCALNATRRCKAGHAQRFA